MLASPPRDSSLWGLALALAVGAATVAVGLDRLGVSRRTVSAVGAAGAAEVELLAVRDGAEAIAAWRARGERGRRVLHFGRFLHFVPRDPALAARLLTRPGTGAVLDGALAAGAGQADYLWVAASLGIARRIDFVSPRPSLEARLAGLGLGMDALPLAIDADDFPRTLHAEIPRIGEPVLVSVNASWFDEATGELLLEALRGSGVRTELVVVDLARDADDVSERARDLAGRFAAGLRAGGEGGR